MQRKTAVLGPAIPLRGGVIQRAKIRIDNWTRAKSGERWKTVETNDMTRVDLERIEDLVHPDDRETYKMAVRFRVQYERPESEHLELKARHDAPRPVLESDDDRPQHATMSRANLLDKQRRAGLFTEYMDQDVVFEEGDLLIPHSDALSKFSEGGFTTMGRNMAAATVIDKASVLVDDSVMGVSTVLNVGHTVYQSWSLGEIATKVLDRDLSDAIITLDSERKKTAATQGISGGASVGTGFVIGSAIGTAIPVPVLGTVVGGVVGAIGGFAAKKVVEIPTTKLLQNKRNIADAVHEVHSHAVVGNPHAIAVFAAYGIPESVAKARDGWKALMDKAGGDSGGRSASQL